jgi:plastocyanin domain-containing protein
MNKRQSTLAALMTLGLFFTLCSKVVAAQSRESVESSLTLKVIVSLVGLGLILLELWWFLFRNEN